MQLSQESKNNVLKISGKDRLKFKINFSEAISEQKPPVNQKGTIEKEQKSFESQYTLGDVIGEGAHAVVKHGWSIKDKKKVAIKVFRSGDPEIVNTIKRTYNNTRFLNHPCLLREMELFINEKTETSFLVMEFCQFPSLESILKKQSCLDESIIRLLAQDLLLTIDYVHLKGICHRDIKPDNILINESALYSNQSPLIKLIDFGVSKRFYQIVPGKVGSFTLDMWTQTGNIHYCAPEILKGGGYDASVDIWAIGVVLYQAITGKLPFQENTMMETIELITDKANNKHFQVEEFKKASLNCQDLIKRLMKPNPKERISCHDSLKHPFLFNQQDKRSKDDEQVSGNINQVKREQLIKSYQFSNLLPNNGLNKLSTKNEDKNEVSKLKEKLDQFKQNTTLDQIQIVKRNNNQPLQAIDLISSFNSYSKQKVTALQQECIKEEKDEIIETSTYENDLGGIQLTDQKICDLDELGCINAVEDVES